MADYALGDRGTVRFITNDYYDAEILQVFEELQLDREKIWNGEARLVPEPDNPYQPNAIAVYIDEFKVGRLTPEQSAEYWNSICRVVASGHDAIALLQLSAVLRRTLEGENYIESQGYLSLSAPGSLFPLNQPPKQATLLPQGPSIKVLDEKNHSEYLHSILPPSGEGRVILALENNQIKFPDGRVVDSVEVFHDRKKVGRLSTQVSAQLAPVIRFAFEQNRLTSAWGTIRGNSLELSLTVQAQRPSELPQDWYDALPNNVPELLAEAEHYDVPPAYVPTEGESNRDLPKASKKQRRGSGKAAVQPTSHVASTQQAADAPLPDTGSGIAPTNRLPLLVGLVGALILLAGIITVFFKPLMGVILIIFGGSLVFLGLFFGRGEEEYEEEEEGSSSQA